MCRGGQCGCTTGWECLFHSFSLGPVVAQQRHRRHPNRLFPFFVRIIAISSQVFRPAHRPPTRRAMRTTRNWRPFSRLCLTSTRSRNGARSLQDGLRPGNLHRNRRNRAFTRENSTCSSGGRTWLHDMRRSSARSNDFVPITRKGCGARNKSSKAKKFFAIVHDCEEAHAAA